MDRQVLHSVLLLATAAMCAGTVDAQAPAAAPRSAGGGVGEIHGRLADSTSGRAVTSGSVTLRRASDTAFAGGALPKEDGSFHIDGVAPGTYTLRIRALGFAQFVRSGIVITAANPTVDLGVLHLHGVVTKLEGQQVVAEREETVIAPDRTSYNTRNMTAASGGTAIDVLRNIPQVEVDGTNKVSLRGNQNVVVQINGRSTPLKGEQLGTFLSQMPANTVKTVEVAANPSAKDDPEGTAGIINIVLNQEAEIGLSGGVNVGTGTTGQVNASGNVGKQQGHVTGFMSLFGYRDSRATSGTISRTNLVIPVPAFVETSMSGRQRPLSGGGNFRGEYRFNDRDALTFDSYLYAGHYGGRNATYYTDLDTVRNMIGAFNQLNDNDSHNLSQDYDVAFRRQGKPTTPQLTAEIEYANNTNNTDVNLSGLVTKPDVSTPSIIPTERDHTVGRYPYVNAKLDFTYPVNPATKFETGGKYADRNTGNDFTAAYLNAATGAFDVNPARNTSFTYREHIGGAYALLSRQLGKFQTQGGVRLEDANTMFDLPLTGQHFDKHYASAYPSGVLTYNITDMRSVRASYSRRVSRPNPYQLSPIEFRMDTRNVFRGNPDLAAEYTNAVDFSLQEAHTWGSLQLNPYVRHTAHAVRNIQFVDANGISVSTFENVASTTTIGSDLNLNYRNGPLTTGAGGSAYHYSSDATNLATNLSTNTFSWSLRANGTYKLSSIVDAQMFSFYRAPTKTEGGSQLASVNLNAGIRYKVWGDQGNISLRINDPFKMQKFGYRTANGSVVEYSERFFGSRALFLTVSRNFGQALRLRPKSESEEGPSAPPTP